MKYLHSLILVFGHLSPSHSSTDIYAYAFRLPPSPAYDMYIKPHCQPRFALSRPPPTPHTHTHYHHLTHVFI